MIDLHTHSIVSDGNLKPIELIDYAFEKNISVIALTDHDTYDGNNQASVRAKEKNMVFVPGIELNVQWYSGEFHLLGLGLQNISLSLKEITERLQNSRDERNRTMIKKMKDDGFDVSFEEITSMFKTNCLGRPHFAEYFVEKKIVKKRQQAFDLYIAKGRPYFVERYGCDLDEAIVAIRDSGGLPVLAHPMSLYLSWGKLPGVLQDLKERGVEGLEAFHPGARVSECLRLEELGKSLGFFITAGSDFHGEKVRADRKIGHTCGGKKIDDRFWFEELKKALAKIE